jgi:hypothetical protein
MNPGISFIGNFVDLITNLDVVARRKILSCRESNPCPPASSLVGMLIMPSVALCNYFAYVLIYHQECKALSCMLRERPYGLRNNKQETPFLC